ncbi:hypothetical protein P4S66_08130 [Pseudoalteromonas sp. B129b]
MKKLTIYLLLLLSVGYSSVALYSLINSDIEDVIICGTNNNTHYIPSDACEYFLFNYRSGKDDIESLESGAGLAFLFEIKDIDKRDAYIEHFISKGIKVNTLSHIDGLSPLHSAILLNDFGLVQLLIGKGASITIKEKAHGLTPLEFIHKLRENNAQINRQLISEFLLSISNNKHAG